LFITNFKVKKLYNRTLVVAGILVLAVLGMIIVFGDRIECI